MTAERYDYLWLAGTSTAAALMSTFSIILTGIATSGVVLSTTRHAADADYRIVVVEDCCADRDPEVHRVLTGKVFPRQATVVKLGEAVGVLGSAV